MNRTCLVRWSLFVLSAAIIMLFSLSGGTAVVAQENEAEPSMVIDESVAVVKLSHDRHTYFPKTIDDVLYNPGMGFTTAGSFDGDAPGYPKSTIAYWGWYWETIEPENGKYRWDIIDETIAEQDSSKLAQMARRLNIEPGATVLDVGSGTGIFLPFLLSQVGRSGQVFALDPAEEMLKKSRAKRFAGQIYYLHADVTSIPVRDRVFDTVVCHSCFPHFQDKARACVEISRVTRAGGRVLICHTSSRAEIIQKRQAGMQGMQGITATETDMCVRVVACNRRSSARCD